VITLRINSIQNELDKRRIEITDALMAIKKESQDELDRYTELLQQNLDHNLKSEIEATKQRAEVELEHTVNETKKLFEEKFKSYQNMIHDKFDQIVKEVDYFTTYISAEIAYNSGEYTEALKMYEKLSQIKPSEKIIWIKAGNILTKIDKLDEAIKHYEHAVSELKEEPVFHYKLASLYAVRNDKSNMLKQLQLLKKKNGEIKKVLNDDNFSDFKNDPDFKNILGLS
ncbi:MAG: hypothetical protein HY606_02795, partial [Planctomycetes bacterium]|nr:hypothetical protein [Planctomycetota bacterium]